MHDALHRRIRFADPQPKGTRLQISEKDIAVFQAIHTHGPLPSNYLFPYSKQADWNTFQSRLTMFFNEGFLSRPKKYFESFFARYQHVVYDLAKAEEYITLSPYIKRTDPWLHRLMCACYTASVERTCLNLGLGYISAHDILSKGNNGSRRLELSVSLPMQRALTPDALFGIHANGKKLFYAIEIDRNTESIERKDITQNAIGKKVAAYLDVFNRKNYQDEWGVPNLRVIIATTNPGHLNNIKAYIDSVAGEHAARFQYKAYSTFGVNWRVPAAILPDVLPKELSTP